jgi:hypothetical protein
MTATLRLLSDTILIIGVVSDGDLRLGMLDGLIRTNASTCNVLRSRWVPAPQHRNQGCEEMEERASGWKELGDIPSPFVQVVDMEQGSSSSSSSSSPHLLITPHEDHSPTSRLKPEAFSD